MNANSKIRAIIGLGNPGKEYEHTYHNIGAWSLPYFQDMLTYQPKSFMNESGLDIARWLKMSNLTIAEVVIVHDDSDLPIGSYKLVKGGGSAGHNGVQSIIDHLGTEEFWRLRIGIRDPQEAVRKKDLEFVLQRFPKEQEAVFKEVLQKAWSELTSSVRTK